MSGRRVVYLLSGLGGLYLRSWLLLGVFLAVGWVVCAYFWPEGPCWRCRGRKTNRGSTKRRYGRCKSCGGTGGRIVIGAQTVHRAARSIWNHRKAKRGAK
jgi:hypothetical protein